MSNNDQPTVGKIEFSHLKPLNLCDLQPTFQRKPFICPVCQGNGLVPNGFYNQTGGNWSSSSTAPESCRTCGGKGIVWG